MAEVAVEALPTRGPLNEVAVTAPVPRLTDTGLVLGRYTGLLPEVVGTKAAYATPELSPVTATFDAFVADVALPLREPLNVEAFTVPVPGFMNTDVLPRIWVFPEAVATRAGYTVPELVLATFTFCAVVAFDTVPLIVVAVTVFAVRVPVDGLIETFEVV